ncbi:efflux transporter outer membrane subunit [Halopseudomonas bauzanensis]|uniref:efflux transporter outer membrane subunit n=1 Tax=Halopseudomonas bauzanensis TaxID=653930 RepID=UPI0025544261|nr:efflux transporter outer membrane subunit [Halopseudomonas bauzanensis]
MRTRQFFPLALAVLLAGCSLATPVPQTDVQPPAQWNQAADSSVWPEARWWTQYDTPQLSRLMAQARAGNLDLASAATRLLQADAQLRQTGATLLPSVDGSASGRRGGNSGDGNVSSGFNASLNASYEIDFWGRNRAAVEAAAANLNASRYDLEALAITTDASVARSWFQLVENQARLQLARDNLAAAEQVLNIVEARYRFGADDSLAVSQQRALVAQLRANLPALEQQTLQLRNSLALLLGQGPDFVPGALPAMTDITVPEPGAGLPSELLNRRPDIRASEQHLLAANANLTAARAALYPSIQLTGSYGAQSSALSDLVSNPLNPWSLAAGLTQPIFDGGRLRAQVEISEASQQEALIGYQRAILDALIDADTALGALQQARRQYQLQQAATAESELAFELAQARYKAGAIDLQNLLDTQRSYFQSQDSLVQQRAAWLLATVDLYRALGGGWQEIS